MCVWKQFHSLFTLQNKPKHPTRDRLKPAVFTCEIQVGRILANTKRCASGFLLNGDEYYTRVQQCGRLGLRTGCNCLSCLTYSLGKSACQDHLLLGTGGSRFSVGCTPVPYCCISIHSLTKYTYAKFQIQPRSLLFPTVEVCICSFGVSCVAFRVSVLKTRSALPGSFLGCKRVDRC